MKTLHEAIYDLEHGAAPRLVMERIAALRPQNRFASEIISELAEIASSDMADASAVERLRMSFHESGCLPKDHDELLQEHGHR